MSGTPTLYLLPTCPLYCVSVSLCNLSIHPLYVCLSACLPLCLSVCLSFCLSVCLSVFLSACLSVCLSVCLPACLFVCVCLCVHLSTMSNCLPVSLFLSIHLFVCLLIQFTTPSLLQPTIHLFPVPSCMWTSPQLSKVAFLPLCKGLDVGRVGVAVVLQP